MKERNIESVYCNSLRHQLERDILRETRIKLEAEDGNKTSDDSSLKDS